MTLDIKWYLHFEESYVGVWLADHRLGQHRLYHLVHVVVRLELVLTNDTVVVYLVRGRESVLFNSCPVKANVASPLVTELKGAFRFFLRHSSEN